MKIKLPLVLLTYILATLPSLAETPAPADGGSVSITQDIHYELSTDTEYKDTVFRVDPSASQNRLEVSFQGDGGQSLTLNKEDRKDGHAQFFFESLVNNPTVVNLFTLSISQLDNLQLGGTYGAIELANYQGDSVFSITDIHGNVSLDNNTIEYGANQSDALVSLHSSGNNTIAISNIGGTLSISNNTKSQGRGQSGLGLLINSYNSTDTYVDNLIQISHVRGGIDIRDNTFSSGQGVIAIFNDVKAGRAVITVDNIAGGIRFVNNSGTYSFGACLSAGCKVDWGGELFSGHATVQLSNIQGNILFQDNSSYVGSAIFVNGTESMLSISGVEGNASFIGNHADLHGGAIYFETGCVSENNILSIQHVQGDVLFEGNSAKELGGAICSFAPIEDEYGNPIGPADARIILLADGGDMIFQNNVMYAGGTEPIANAILADGKHQVELGAAAGRRIAFYDPIVIQDEQENASSLYLNEGSGSEGEILFSGRDYADSDNAANYTSTLTGDAIQYNGIVRLDQRAALQLVNYVQEGGTLAMGRRTSLTASGNVSLKTLTLDLREAGDAASITSAGAVSADRLTVYGSSSSVAAGETVLTIKAASFGGILEQPADDYKAAMTDDRGMTFLLGMNWELNEEGALVFTTGHIMEEGVIAELQGSNIANSMLSCASTLRSFSGTGLAHLDKARFLSPLKSNVWTSGLGDFQMQRTKSGIEGFDYQGGGFAAGGDYRLGEQWLGGVAYGYTSGKNISREYRATNRQNTNMGLIYTGWRLPMNKGQALTITAAAGFSSSDNSLSSVTSGGQNSSGSWTNRAWDGTVKAAWDLPVGRGLVLTPQIGVEYTDVVQEAFTERGEMARRFERGHYRNLALPVGLSLTRSLTVGGMPWSHTVSVEYLPDVYRSNAGTHARLIGSGYEWGVKGSKPARQGVRAGISGRLQVTDNWSTYGSYQVEARDNFVNQSVMLGAGYSF